MVSLSHIHATTKTQQRLTHGLLPYLRKHGLHIDSMAVRGCCTVSLRQLPTSLQLTSLQLQCVSVQLQPGGGYEGVLRPGLPLKQLRLGIGCVLLDEDQGLAAALHGLPRLEHLTVSISSQGVAAGVLQQLQQVTYLDLHCKSGGFRYGQTFLQPLQALTHLVDLRVGGNPNHHFTADMLSGLCSLTRLSLTDTSLDPAALAGKTQLQHLQLFLCNVPGGAAGIAQLLWRLQDLTKLTYLSLKRSLCDVDRGNPPAASFSALTASSNLQHLDISWCMLPEGAWQHVFPAGGHLPRMQSLVLENIAVLVRGSMRGGGPLIGRTTPAPDGSVVSCCPGLQSLDLQCVLCSKGLLCALPRLSKLTLLRLGFVEGVRGSEVLESMCRLTELRSLQVVARSDCQGLILLTQLKQLTHLRNASYVRASICRAR